MKATVIVLGNEKGGSGKSTTAMHLIVGLLRLGLRVGSLDLDARQGTLSRYVENRQRKEEGEGSGFLPMPEHVAVTASALPDPEAARHDEEVRLEALIGELAARNDVVVVDSPGSASHLTQLGHSYADILITPMNDSFIDLDVLARVEPETLRIIRPSHYAEIVWEEKKRRAMRDGGTMDWIVMRNRLAHLDARNKQNMETVLDALSRRIGFRLVPGFGERVIYRELFLNGMTMMDLAEADSDVELSMSHLAARQEVRTLIEALR
ncbi:MAG: division plane positioning ATPase MipZ, partial [Rhodospirillales bacterium]|nr:division plane positioning ATPase MipZ [Rhodospirillales bacterium]